MKAESPSKVESAYQAFEERIRLGVWKVGDCLPTEAELAVEFNCGRNTVSKAVTRLVHEGLVERKKRAGTRVLRNISERGGAPIELDAYAFIYPSEQHDSIWRTLKGFQEAAQKASRRIVMLSSGVGYKKEAEFIGRLAEFDVKGAVVFPLLTTPDEVVNFSRLLVSSQRPIVLTEISLPALGFPTVLADGFHAAYTVTRHMLERGAKRIGFFANYAHIPIVRDEYRGYLWAMEEASLEPPKRGVLLDPAMNPDFDDPLKESTSLARRFLSVAGSLDAVVCANDFLATGCIHAANEARIKVPDQMLVGSCDDYALPGVDGVSLTTYRIPHKTIGRKTFEVLNDLVEGKSLVHNEALIRGELILGKSA